ncbi:MAG TPA: PIN domain-containing protein [Kofleriaceae bacterium]|nr:PIN domain-containing protein [Kofleriaceae bacterium]
MADRVFVDTNLFVYADDLDAGAKRDRAQQLLRELIGDGRAVVSTQVLQEFFVIATRKLGVPADIARRKVELMARLDLVQVRPDLVLSAIDLHRLRSLSFWDALIVRSAVAASCARLLTEDMQHGEVIDGVRIENPFRDAG